METKEPAASKEGQALVFNPEEVNYLVPPGEMLAEELRERGMTQSQLAKLARRPVNTINAIVAGRKAITPDTALDLQKALGIRAEFWLNMEMSYQLAKARARRRRVVS